MKQDEAEQVVNRLKGSDSDIEYIKNLTERYFSMIAHMEETSLYDVFMYEKNVTKKTADTLKILSYENTQLKKEVNGLRKKLKMKIKYNVPQVDEDEQKEYFGGKTESERDQ